MDEAGNSVSMERTIVRDSTAPILVVNIYGSTMEEGTYYYRTKSSEANEMVIRGYTDDALQVFVNGEAVPMTEEGYFEYVYRIQNVDGVNPLTVSAVDMAGNNVTWERNITHETIGEDTADEFEWGLIILIMGLIILIVMVLVGTILVRRSVGTVEPMPEVDEDEVLAPAEMPEVDEGLDEDLEEEEEEDLEEEEDEDEDLVVGDDLEDEEDEEEKVFTVSAPARPKTDSRRPKPAAKEVPKPEEEEKDLSEKDADAEAGADETDQEGI